MLKNKSSFSSVLIIGGAILVAVVLMVIGGRGKNTAVRNPGTGHLARRNQQAVLNDQPVGDFIRLEDDDPVLGDPNAPVALVEFGDYQCTFCTRFFKETEPALVEKYVNSGKLKIIFRDLVVNGRESQNAAQAAACADEQGKFWKYHDRLFRERKGYNAGVFKKDNLTAFASDLGLDIEQFNQCYEDEKYKNEIAKDGRDAARFGANGTPTFFLNGKRIPGAQPLRVFESAIEQLL